MPLSAGFSPLNAPLTLYIFAPDLAAVLQDRLAAERYQPVELPTISALSGAIASDPEAIDCLILQQTPEVEVLLASLGTKGPLLPVVLLAPTAEPPALYHAGEVQLWATQLSALPTAIERAVGQFLGIVAAARSNRDAQSAARHRLAQRLKERLSYTGLYYKRNPEAFYRHLSPEVRAKSRQHLAAQYRQIVLAYFTEDPELNAAIDRLAEEAFFVDLSVTQIVEIHMELMEEFTQQLRLEGRNEEILLDYRLALIDVIAHLSEMYRRSLPRDRR